MLQRVMMLTLPLLLTGCLSLDPHYQRPAAPVPANLPQGEAGGNQALSYPDVAWRDYVQDARLRQVVALGLNSSRDLRERSPISRRRAPCTASSARRCSRQSMPPPTAAAGGR